MIEKVHPSHLIHLSRQLQVWTLGLLHWRLWDHVDASCFRNYGAPPPWLPFLLGWDFFAHLDLTFLSPSSRSSQSGRTEQGRDDSTTGGWSEGMRALCECAGDGCGEGEASAASIKQRGQVNLGDNHKVHFLLLLCVRAGVLGHSGSPFRDSGW